MKRVGHGGMGAVYRVQDRTEDRTLALKLLTVEEAASMPPSDTSCSTPSSCWMKGRQETIAPPVRAINHLIRTARSSWHAAQPFSVSAASTTAL